MLTIVHAASGAILGTASHQALLTGPGLITVAGHGSADDQWWDGAAFVQREDATVALSLAAPLQGESVTIDKPEGAWARLPDGRIGQDAGFLVPDDARGISVTLVGRYRGQVSALVGAAA